MLKYITTAVALKVFSSNALARGQYRRLGNSLGGKRRRTEAMPGYYPDRLKRMLRLQRQHNIVRDGDRILELGTGWLHWEAITLRLFVDIEAVLFDVWDNRQLEGLKNYLRQLRPLLNDGFGLSEAELQRAHSLIESIVMVESFDELYNLLGFKYVVETSGSLSQFFEDSFQLVVSAGVLEHVKRDAFRTLIEETRRVLKPGGWALHSIDTSDHLAHYDRTVSRKMYLGFSEWTWRCLFENEVQYINRVQREEWLQLFRSCDFELIEEESQQINIDGLKLAETYAQMERRDLECTVLRVALRKLKS
jgi:SAM-dependent methyltransferase